MSQSASLSQQCFSGGDSGVIFSKSGPELTLSSDRFGLVGCLLVPISVLPGKVALKCSKNKENRVRETVNSKDPVLEANGVNSWITSGMKLQDVHYSCGRPARASFQLHSRSHATEYQRIICPPQLAPVDLIAEMAVTAIATQAQGLFLRRNFVIDR